MSKVLKLKVCDVFRKEAEAAVRASGLEDIRLSFLNSDCYSCHRRKRDKAAAGGAKPIDERFLGPEGRHRNPFVLCQSLLAGEALIDHLVQTGAYVATPGWLAHWQQQIVEKHRFDQETFQEFLSESVERIVLLDSGVYPGCKDDLEAFAQFAGLPVEVVPVGLDHFRSQLQNVYQAWRLEKAETEGDQLRRRFADLSLAVEFMDRATALMKQESLALVILEHFIMLTGAEFAVFTPAWEGVSGAPVFYRDRVFPHRPLNAATAENLDSDGGSDDGFTWCFQYNGRCVGLLEISQLPFRQYRSSYIEAAQAVSSVFALALFNTRTYEALLEANQKLLEMNTGLEGIVTRRTAELLESNRNLQELNALLEEEISEREVAETTVRQLNDALRVSNARLAVEIANQRQVSDALRTAKEAADQANSAKSTFLANMSHELRTPLNGIMGLTELTILSAVGKEQRERLDLVLRAMQSFKRIIDDILDYTRIEAGRLPLDKKSFDLRQLLQEVGALFTVICAQKDLQMSLTVGADVPEFVTGDMVRVRQVLSNLIGNAVKFSPSGEIAVSVDREAGRLLRFAVKDHGIGIPETQKDRLFQRFTQLDSSYTKKYQGTGLGLVISKGLAEAMGGTVWFDSQENVGSTFYFTAELPPSAQAEEPTSECLPAARRTQRAEQPVLVAEDDAISRHMISCILEREGFRCLLAENGQMAVSLFMEQPVSIVLMDVQMPVMDGLSATQRIRAMEREDGHHTPIIALTAYAMPEDKCRCLEAGMDDYMSKPVSLTLIHQILERYLR